MKIVVLALALLSTSTFAQDRPSVLKPSGIPCSLMTSDSTAYERKTCSKDVKPEDFCKNFTKDTTTKTKKLCEKRAAEAAASTASK